MSGYYQGSRGGGGGPPGYGRGAGRGYPPMGYQQGPPPPMADPRDPMMRGGRGYEFETRGSYDYEMGGGGEPSHRGATQPPRMAPPVVPPQQQESSRGSNPQPGGVRYANDCEIIVTAKAQQQYAEMIEKAIREFRLNVDIMFPKPDVKLAAFIENISSTGTIFAVVIRPDNEAHRSVSVHVLRGCPKPEEHRNMPLTAAYQLIKERYTEIKRREVGVVPENMKAIFRSLLDENALADKQYTIIIKFLQDRRRKQKAFENRTNNIIGDAATDDDLLNNPDAEELKQRISSILNGHSNPSGERIGELLVPRPKEPLPADPMSSIAGGPPQQGSGRGMGRGYNRDGY